MFLGGLSFLEAKDNSQILKKILDESLKKEVRLELMDSINWEAIELPIEKKIEIVTGLLPLVEKPIKKLELQDRICHWYFANGQYEESIKNYKETLKYAKKVEIKDWEHKIILSLVQKYTIKGELELAEEELNKLFKKGVSNRISAIGYICLADINNVRGEFIKAKENAHLALSCHTKGNYDLGQGEAYQYIAMISLNLGDFDSTVYYSDKMYDIFKKDNYLNQLAIACYYKALGFKGNFQFEKGISYLDSAKYYFKKIGNLGGSISCLDKMSSFLMESGQYERAKGFYLEAVQLQGKHKAVVYEMAARNLSLAHCYLKLKEYSNAKSTLDKVLEILKDEEKNAQWSLLHNLYGDYYLAKQQLGPAEKEYQLALANFGEGANPEKKINIFLGLASVKQIQKDFKASNNYLFQAERLSDNNLNGSQIQQMLAQNYKSLGMYDLAIEAMEKYQVYQDSLSEEQKNLTVQETLAKYQVERAIDKEKLAKSEKAIALAEASKQKILKWFGFILLALVILSFLVIYKRSKQLRVEKERSTKLKLEAANTTIEHSMDILKSQSNMILEKNRIIKELRDNLEDFFDVDLGSKEKFMVLLERRILTKEDWINFKKSFFVIYPDFMQNAENKFPNITEAELRVLCFTKLGLQKQEMADMLGVLPKSIQRTISRFKQKFNVEVELEFLIDNL